MSSYFYNLVNNRENKMIRIFFFFCLMLTNLGFDIQQASSSTIIDTIEIDLRTRSKKETHPRYTVTFYAVKHHHPKVGDVGHAYVAWRVRDGNGAIKIEKFAGFYPLVNDDVLEADERGEDPYNLRNRASDKAVDWNKSFIDQAIDLTTVKGKFWNDETGVPDLAVHVHLEREAQRKSLIVFQKWKQRSRYGLGWHDCTTFVGEIAKAIGLVTGNRLQNLLPFSFVQDIILRQQKKNNNKGSNSANVQGFKGRGDQDDGDIYRPFRGTLRGGDQCEWNCRQSACTWEGEMLRCPCYLNCDRAR